MTAVIETEGLGKRYRRQWALADCTLSIPAGHVVGLVGPNGAGKTTLLNLATGMLAPTTGTIEVLGGRPAAGPAQLARVGYLAQDAPVYAGLSVADHLQLGAHLNPGWDAALARRRIEQLDLDPGQKAGKLSGGQRAQLALTLALGKRPELLILDEPVASLDPLARREFLQDLMETVAEQEVSVVLSSHLISDLERVCDYLIVLADSRVRIAGPVDELLATHHLLSGPRRDQATLPAGLQVISASHTDRQSTLLVRAGGPVLDPAWTVSEVGLEDLVLAYMKQAAGRGPQPQPPPGGAEMIWLTWRQFRAQAITAAAALAAFAILLAITEPRLASLYATSGFAACHGGSCAGLANAFLSQLSNATPFGGPQGFRLLPDGTNLYVIVYVLSVLLILIAPAITGVFWGAPLIARELETGTCRLTWNQSITRTRWLTVKLALIGAAAMAVTEAFSLLQAWWAAPIGQATGLGGSVSVFSGGRFSPFVFPTGGIAPLGYAAFGFALGVTAGLLIRRAVPAMAVTLAIFAAVQVVMPLWVRPHLFPPDQTIATIESTQRDLQRLQRRPPTLTASVVPGQPGAWIISSEAVNAAGQPVTSCPPPARRPRRIPTAAPAAPRRSKAVWSAAWPATGSGRPSATSPPATTGPSS